MTVAAAAAALADAPKPTPPAEVVRDVEVLPALTDIDRPMFRDTVLEHDATPRKPVSETSDDERSFLFGWLTWWGRGTAEAAPDRSDNAVEPQESSSEAASPAPQAPEEQEAKAPWWSGWKGWWSGGERSNEGPPAAEGPSQPSDPSQPLSRVDLPPDLDIEALAEEVQNSWRLKEVHVENLLQRALARRERPWLVLLSILSAASVVMLLVVFYRLEHL